MAKFCSNCGAESKPGAKFCEYCGTKLMQEEVTTPPPAPSAVMESDNPYRRSTGTNNTGAAGAAGYPWERASAESAYNPFPESGIVAQFFTTKGRLNRLRYFKRCMGIAGIALVLIIISGILIGMNHAVMGGLALVGIIIGAQIASICLVVRRFHDMEPADNTDHNFMVLRMGAYIGFIFAGWVWDWAWILNTLMSLYLLFNTGVRGANRHGADPLGNN
ncbi:MAG: zinc-ribbon domain-containing protein [Selenomonadaceae bacterium]|nr:zinc-ribbon domain-containing protein [Selenomonadaceae bacterium]